MLPLLLWSSAALVVAAAEEPRFPNILLLSVDEQHPDLLGAAGHPVVETPNLDRLAAEGVYFTGAYTAAPLCSPARATWYTGRYPTTHGLLEIGGTLDEDEVATALPALLQWYGYSTALIGKLHVGPARRWFTDVFLEGNDGVLYDRLSAEPGHNVYEAFIAETFPDFPVPHPWPYGYSPTDEFAPGGAVLRQPWKVGTAWIPYRDHEIRWMAERVVAYLREKQDSPRPWFLHFSVHKPHSQYVLPEPWDRYYDPSEVLIPPSFVEMSGSSSFLEVRHEAELRQLLAHYYGAMTMVDDTFGLVLDALDELELGSNTIVVYLSDHGALMGEHNRVLKRYMWDGSARVPLIVRAPGLPRGRIRDEIFDQTSVMPTILDLAGIPLPDNLEGRSLVPLARDENASWENVAFSWLEDRMVRRGPYKLIDPYIDGGHVQWLLYDLSTDRWEVENLYAEPGFAAVRADLEEELVRWWKREDPGPVVLRPAIIRQPRSVFVRPGGSASFDIAAVGGTRLAYRWQRNGSDLENGSRFAGADTPTLTVHDVDATATARYRCRVTSLDPRGGVSYSTEAGLTTLHKRPLFRDR